MHRYTKACLQKKKVIKAYIVKKEVIDKCKICKVSQKRCIDNYHDNPSQAIELFYKTFSGSK